MHATLVEFMLLMRERDTNQIFKPCGSTEGGGKLNEKTYTLLLPLAYSWGRMPQHILLIAKLFSARFGEKNFIIRFVRLLSLLSPLSFLSLHSLKVSFCSCTLDHIEVQSVQLLRNTNPLVPHTSDQRLVRRLLALALMMLLSIALMMLLSIALMMRSSLTVPLGQRKEARKRKNEYDWGFVPDQYNHTFIVILTLSLVLSLSLSLSRSLIRFHSHFINSFHLLTHSFTMERKAVKAKRVQSAAKKARRGEGVVGSPHTRRNPHPSPPPSPPPKVKSYVDK